MNDDYYMKIAIAESKKGDWPYGAVLVKNNEIIAQGHNTTERDLDCTAHAEVNVIRMGTQAMQSPSLEGCTLYTSSEPCPMCACAAIWAGISRVVYGASIKELIAAGNEQIDTSSAAIIKTGFANIELVGGILAQEALEVVKNWLR